MDNDVELVFFSLLLFGSLLFLSSHEVLVWILLGACCPFQSSDQYLYKPLNFLYLKDNWYVEYCFFLALGTAAFVKDARTGSGG